MVTAKYPHRPIISERARAIRESKYERLTAALWTAVIALGVLAGSLITAWIFMQTDNTAPPVIDKWKIGGSYWPNIPTPLEQPVVASPNEQPIEFEPLDAKFQSVFDALSSSDISAIPEDIGTQSNGIEGNAIDDGQTDGDQSLGSRRRRNVRQHWVIEVPAIASEREYVRLLQQFGIELAAVFEDGTVVYLENPGPQASTRRGNVENEDRFFTVWNDGDLQYLDASLFSDAGQPTEQAKIVHFFPPALERELNQLAISFVGRSESEIRRTRFAIERTDGAFRFVVTRQTGAPLN